MVGSALETELGVSGPGSNAGQTKLLAHFRVYVETVPRYSPHRSNWTAATLMRARALHWARSGLLSGALAIACGKLDSGEPVIFSVAPDSAALGSTETILVEGENFFGSANVDLDSRRGVPIDTNFRVYLGTAALPATNVNRIDTHQLTFNLPAGLQAAKYSVTLVTPDGRNATSPRPIEIVPRADPLGSGGSSTVTIVSLAGCTKAMFQTSVYVFCPTGGTRLNWWDANASCEAAGMELPRINSAEENAFVATHPIAPAGGGLVWLAANDIATEGVWVWGNGEQLWAGDDCGVPTNGLYNNWKLGGPNNNSPEPGQDCAQLDQGVSDGRWGDIECSDRQTGFVCEKGP